MPELWTLGIIARAMRFAFTFILIELLAAGCHRREAKLAHQIVGAWNHVGGGFSMTISSDGSFASGSSNVAYQGTWLVQDSVLVATITNATGKQHEPVGSIDRMKIVQADESHLTIETSGQTIYYERR